VAQEENAKKDDGNAQMDEMITELQEEQEHAKDKHKIDMAARKTSKNDKEMAKPDEAAKRKGTHAPGDKFHGRQIRSVYKKDLMILSPVKKKPHGVGIHFDNNKSNDKSFSSAESSEEEVTLIPTPSEGHAIPEPVTILCSSKVMMLQAAKAGVKEGIEPFFDAGNVGHNREGISPSDYENVAFIEPTITFQPKSDDFKGIDMK
jgi:hypothetical protein